MLTHIRDVPLEHVRDFIRIADTGTMSAAQTSLRSKEDILFSIQLLEQKLGSTLIQRDEHTLRLTSEAKRFLPYANALVFCVDDIRRRLTEAEAARALH